MPTISEATVIAFQSYQAGNLPQAQLICHQILQQQPESTEALDMLGMIAHQLGKLEEAINYYQQLLALMPEYAETYYRLGSALHSLGRLPDAIANYQKALDLNPNYTDVHYELGIAFQQQGNLDAAIQHYQQAITLNPNDAEACGNLANALLECGQIEAAIAHYQQVLVSMPNVPGIYYNLGSAYMLQSQWEAAITCFRWALSLDPNYGDAYLQLGKALHISNKLEEAVFYYQQALFFKPDSPDVCYNLGKALLKQSRWEEAISRYQQAVALQPDFLGALLELGCILLQSTRLEEATIYLQQALALNSEHPDTLYNLGLVLANQSQVNEAIDYFQKALQVKPDFLEAYWQSQLIVPIVYETQEQIPLWRQRFCRKLNRLIQHTSLETVIDRQGALERLSKTAFTFYLNYQGFNDRGIQCKYGNFVHQILAAHYPQWSQPLSLPPLSSEGKIRVGYLSTHFRGQTVAKLTLGWLKHCDRQQFEIYCYHLDEKADILTEQFRSASDHFYHLFANLEDICQQIIADNLHILVFTDIGMDARITPLAGLRLAPVQCMTWGHPITSGLPTIDYFLSSDLMEPEDAETHYSEQLVRLPNISICYEKPAVPELTKTRSEFHLREDAIIYLSCQSLFKYLPQFDSIFPKIAQQVPQSQFAFISSHANPITAKFKARLHRAFAQLGLKSEDYCVFVPRLDWISYLNLNLVSNIFLDTFSWSGGNTTLEAIACGLPVVTCPGEFMRSRHAYGILQMMGVTETIAQNETEYIEIAVRLGLDSRWRQEVGQKICDRHSWLYDDRSCLTALEAFYKKVVLEHPLSKRTFI